MVEGLILDFDGLIADSEEIWFDVLTDLYRAQGAELTRESWLKGVGSSLAAYDPFAELAALSGVPAPREALERQGEAMFRGRMRRSVPLPGVVRLLDRAATRGLRCAVASSSRRESVVPYLRQYGILDRFDHVVTREAVDHPKPAPDLYLEALDRLGLGADGAVAFEDSVPGLTAARAAGLRCVVVPGVATRHLDYTGCTLRLPTLKGFDLDHLTGCARA